MKIIALNIYGYGKITETEFDTNQHFVQLFGENEAGKSTMQSFIHSILFGFPTRKEQEPRREPRMHNLYGGKITVEFPDESGIVEIERIKGKVQGDVKIYFEDGTVRGEEWLIKKMNFIDKRTYRSIFSFDVLGLQDIHKNMTEDKLQEYLLRAGALGSHEYDEMLSAIDAELGTIYKRNGSKPELNKEIAEMADLNDKIRALEQVEERYNTLTSERVKTEEALNFTKDGMHQLESIRKQKMKEVVYHKDIKEWKTLESQVNIEPINFPEKGVERYEKVKHQLQQSEQDIALRIEKLKVLEAELASVEKPDGKQITHLEGILKKEPEIKQKRLEHKRLASDIASNEEAIGLLMRDIGWSQEHHEVDDSNIVKESVQSLLSKLDEVTLEEQFLVREFDQMKSDINHYDQELAQLEAEQISETRIRKKQELMDKEFELKEKEKMFSLIEKDYEREKRRRNRSSRMQQMLITGVGIVALIVGIFYLVESEWLIGSTSTVAGALIFLLLTLNREKPDESLKEDYQKDVAELQEAIETINRNHDMEFELSTARELKMDLKGLKAKRISTHVRLEELKETLSNKEALHDSLNTDLSKMKADLNINMDMENKTMPDAIHTIREIKQKRNQINRYQIEMDNLTRELQEFKSSFKEDLVQYGIHYDDTSVFHDIKNAVSGMYKDEADHNRLNDQVTLLQNENKVLQDSIKEAQYEITSLLDQVGAEDEETYYYYARKDDEHRRNVRRYNELDEKLDEEHFDYDARNALADILMSELREEEEDIVEQIEALNDKIQVEQKTLAELNSEIAMMESDGKLSELHHLYEMKKSYIQNMSRDYMSLNYIRILIEAHIRKIKDERLPVVIEEARTIFQKITSGRYVNIIYDDDGVKVKHGNGQLFHPLELSQSTKEMLYISLRLSLIKALKGYYKLPLIIDDAFVHFDKERKKIIMDYLKDEVQDQVLYFTCNLDNSIPASQTIKLKEKVK